MNGFDFIKVGLYSSGEDHVPKELFRLYIEDIFFSVESHPTASDFYVDNKGVDGSALSEQIVNINFYILANLVVKNFIQQALVSRSSIFQTNVMVV